MKTFLVFFCCLTVCLANTNIVTTIANNDNLDKINIDMKENYRLKLKQDRSLSLTGYSIQDVYTKLVKTYSVLRLEF